MMLVKFAKVVVRLQAGCRLVSITPGQRDTVRSMTVLGGVDVPCPCVKATDARPRGDCGMGIAVTAPDFCRRIGVYDHGSFYEPDVRRDQR